MDKKLGLVAAAAVAVTAWVMTGSQRAAAKRRQRIAAANSKWMEHWSVGKKR